MVNRFLKILLVLFGGLLFSLPEVKAQKPWQLAIQTWTFHKFSLLQSIDKADSLGIRNIEVYPWQRVGGAYGDLRFGPDMDAASRRFLLNYLQQKKIHIIAMGVLEKAHYKDQQGVRAFFDFAKQMKMSFITAEPEWEDLDLFNKLAGEYHIKVALHCHPKPYSHYWHPDSISKAMQGRKNIGAWPDIGHLARNGADVLASLQQFKEKFWGMHFKDVKELNILQAGDTLFGKGANRLSGILQELKKQDFKGVVTMEYESNENDNMADMKLNKAWYDAEMKRLFGKAGDR